MAADTAGRFNPTRWTAPRFGVRANWANWANTPETAANADAPRFDSTGVGVRRGALAVPAVPPLPTAWRLFDSQRRPITHPPSGSVSTHAFESRLHSLDAPRGPSNETLLARFIAGDSDAFAMLVSRLERPIFSFILRMLNDRQTAEDVFQDTFVRLLRGAATFQPTQSLTAWVFRIARNLCIDTIRRQKHRHAVSLEDANSGKAGRSGGTDGDRPSLAEQLPGTTPAPDHTAMTSELSQRLGDAVNRLAPELREVVLLKEASGLTFKEIADLTDTPESTLKSRMQTALEKLRSELGRIVR